VISVHLPSKLNLLSVQYLIIRSHTLKREGGGGGGEGGEEREKKREREMVSIKCIQKKLKGRKLPLIKKTSMINFSHQMLECW
jgi:hypothetical protein